MLKRCLQYGGLGMMLALLVACQTLQGLGKDVQAGGRAIEHIGN